MNAPSQMVASTLSSTNEDEDSTKTKLV